MEATRYRKDVAYFIEMPGLASDSVGCVTLDGVYALCQVHPTYTLAVAPPLGADHPSLSKVVFYANCLSYEHDLPTLVAPARAKVLVRPVEEIRPSQTAESYYDDLGLAFEALKSVRLGSLAYVTFRWPGWARPVDLEYTRRYGHAAKELSLYGWALRQLDPLSEFLGYYRVIEAISGGNPKAWLSQTVDRLGEYRFGFIELGSDARRAKPRRRRNLLTTYKRRALARLRALASKPSGTSVERYFHNVNRCGIAHGWSRVRVYDFDADIREVAQDVYVLKLLARIGIEDKIGSPPGR